MEEELLLLFAKAFFFLEKETYGNTVRVLLADALCFCLALLYCIQENEEIRVRIFSIRRGTRQDKAQQMLDVVVFVAIVVAIAVASVVPAKTRDGDVPKVCSCWKAERTMLVDMREGRKECVWLLVCWLLVWC